MVYVFLAEGFEETEALVPVDILRRAGAEVKTVGVGGQWVSGSHGITVRADVCEDALDRKELEMVVLPGGMPGTLNLEKSKTVQDCIDFANEKGIFLAAICAAPSILGHKGLLRGKKAVCYPGFEKELTEAIVQHTLVCEDGSLITAKGPGAAYEFGLLLAAKLKGRQRSETIRSSLQLS